MMGRNTPSATIVCVLSNNLIMNERWIEHHKGIIPPTFPVLLVDNTTIFDFHHLGYLQHVPYGWRVVKNHRPLFPTTEWDTHLTHGKGLDFATKFVTTPYIITIDNDCFLQDASPLELLLKTAVEECAGAVGWSFWENIVFPYITPILAVYETQLARKYKFEIRLISSETMMERYAQFYKPQYEQCDAWAALRRGGFLDVGQYLHYEAVLAGGKVICWEGRTFAWGKAWHIGNASEVCLFSPDNPFLPRSLNIPTKLGRLSIHTELPKAEG